MGPGTCIIKRITAVINSVTSKASAFVKASKKWLTIAKALSYSNTELITAVKSFMIQALSLYYKTFYDSNLYRIVVCYFHLFPSSGQCYKIFNGHELCLFIISYSVYPWQAFTA